MMDKQLNNQNKKKKKKHSSFVSSESSMDKMKSKKPDFRESSSKSKMSGKKGMKKTKQSEIQEDMKEILADSRFAHIALDPKFRYMPKNKHKVKLDNRFSSILTDNRFYEKSTMDPRGRRGNYSTKEDLLKFYQLSSEEESDDDDDDDDDVGEEEEEVEEHEKIPFRVKEEVSTDEDDVKTKALTSEKEVRVKEEVSTEEDDVKTKALTSEKEVRVKEEVSTEEDDVKTKALTSEKVADGELEDDTTTRFKDTPEDIEEKMRDMNVDYARGDVVFSDDSSDDDSTTTEEDENEEFEWGMLDQDAVWEDEEHQVEETSRIAVCNMDWDRIKAADMMVLFNSFCPRGGAIKKVAIYPSEYGKQRMAEENQSGPQELKAGASKQEIDFDYVNLEKLEKGQLDESSGATKKDYEALRRYQRNRLRYYYTVVECDTVDTARVLYKECDRQPYEGAGVLLDLRYIPSDMTFEEAPHDVCETVPNTYEVKTFTTTALHESRPTLTWDETDPERKKIMSLAMSKAMKGEDVEDEYLKAFLVSSSEGEDDGSNSGDEDSNSDDEETKASRIAKFRALISEIDEKEKKKNAEKIDMEEVFDMPSGDEEEDEEESEDSETEDVKKDLKPFEKYLEKRKNKRKEREKKKKVAKNHSKDDDDDDDSDDSDVDDAISDDELPEDLGDIYSDPFFAEELKKRNSKKKKKEKYQEAVKEEPEGADNNEGNLELLLMDEEDEERKHFSMRDIIDNNKNKDKKKRWKEKKKKKMEEKKEKKVVEDHFKVDTMDHRFSQLLTSGEFNIDPSHPHFKRTKAMDSLINEVQQKRMAESYEDIPEAKRPNKGGKNSDHELSLLVKRVKNKANKPKKMSSTVG